MNGCLSYLVFLNLFNSRRLSKKFLDQKKKKSNYQILDEDQVALWVPI